MLIIELCPKFVSCYNFIATLCTHHAGSSCRKAEWILRNHVVLRRDTDNNAGSISCGNAGIAYQYHHLHAFRVAAIMISTGN